MATTLGELKEVGGVTIERLKEAGVKSIEDLAQANLDDLEDAGIPDTKAERIQRRAQRNAVIIQSGDEVTEEYESKDTISTGMEVFDEAIGGGWEEGFLVAIAGEAGTGKTQLAFKSLVEAVEQTGKPAVYIETERGRYRDERLQSLSNEEGTQEKIHRVKAYDLDQQELAYEKIASEFDELSLVVVDSFTARFRLSDKFEDRSTLSERSTVMARHLTKLESVAENLQIPILITGQVYSNPGAYGSSDYVYGGSLFQHTVSFLVKMSQAQGVMVSAEIQGHPGQSEKELHIRIGDDDLEALNNT